MRTNELLSALGAEGTVTVTISRSEDLDLPSCSEEGLELPSCTVKVDYHPYVYHKGATVFDAALKVAKELAGYPGTPIRVREALKAFDRRTETLI